MDSVPDWLVKPGISLAFAMDDDQGLDTERTLVMAHANGNRDYMLPVYDLLIQMAHEIRLNFRKVSINSKKIFERTPDWTKIFRFSCRMYDRVAMRTINDRDSDNVVDCARVLRDSVRDIQDFCDDEGEGWIRSKPKDGNGRGRGRGRRRGRQPALNFCASFLASYYDGRIGYSDTCLRLLDAYFMIVTSPVHDLVTSLPHDLVPLPFDVSDIWLDWFVWIFSPTCPNSVGNEVSCENGSDSSLSYYSNGAPIHELLDNFPRFLRGAVFRDKTLSAPVWEEFCVSASRISTISACRYFTSGNLSKRAISRPFVAGIVFHLLNNPRARMYELFGGSIPYISGHLRSRNLRTAIMHMGLHYMSVATHRPIVGCGL